MSHHVILEETTSREAKHRPTLCSQPWHFQVLGIDADSESRRTSSRPRAAILMMLFQPVSTSFNQFHGCFNFFIQLEPALNVVRLQEELVSVSRRIEESWANSEQGYWLLGREPLASLEKHFDISGRIFEANIVVPFL